MSGFRRQARHSASPEPAIAVSRAARGNVRSRWVLGVFAYLVSTGLVAALLVEPTGLSSAATLAGESESFAVGDIAGQRLHIEEEPELAHGRDAFDVVKLAPPRPSAPAAGTPDPGTAQSIAYDMVVARGWDQGQFDCLVALWNRESGWNTFAHNTRSGAYGIPQALPGNKMATAGADWASNPVTQITWGLGYIQGRYGTPCDAWGHSERKGWY